MKGGSGAFLIMAFIRENARTRKIIRRVLCPYKQTRGLSAPRAPIESGVEAVSYSSVITTLS